jgi:hypothetical protein
MIAFKSPGGRMSLLERPRFVRWAYYPYGKWTCEDGREILFNRYYKPI